MKAIAFIKQYAMAIVAGIAIIGFSSFNLYQKETLTDVVFTYQPPGSLTNPFDDSNVKNTNYWKPLGTECPTDQDQEVACSIRVPIENTEDEAGLALDPSKVSIQTTFFATNNYGVTTHSSYSNPRNKPMP